MPASKRKLDSVESLSEDEPQRSKRVRKPSKKAIEGAESSNRQSKSKKSQNSKGKQNAKTVPDSDSDSDNSEHQPANSTMPSQSAGPTRTPSVILVESDSDEEKNEDAPISSNKKKSQTRGNKDDEASEAELERMMKAWNSPFYAFFQSTPDIEYKDNRRTHAFGCKAKGCKYRVRRYLDTSDATSTGNMAKHVKSCWGHEVWKAAKEAKSAEVVRKTIIKTYQKNGSITDAFERKDKYKVTYSHRQHTAQETRAEIVRWVCESLRPFAIVQDRGFLNLMKTGRPGYYIPSPSTVSRDVRLVFARARDRIAEMLQTYDGKISLATDAWTSPNHRSFVAVTVHLERDGLPLSFLLDLVEVAEAHTGEALAKALAEVLKEYGINVKILELAADNASSNDTMVEELSFLVDEFPGEQHQVRCFLHVLNLVAKKLLRQFDIEKKKTEDITTDEDRLMQELADGLEVEELQSVIEGLADTDISDDDNDGVGEDLWVDDSVDILTVAERASLKETIKLLQRVLAKLRRLAFKVVHSSTKLLPMWKQTVEDLKLSVRLMPRDVRTRWNSTFAMLDFALEYQKPIDAICVNREAGLRMYELTEGEWRCVEQLRDVLQAFSDATSIFSASQPNLSRVIPIMDALDRTLTTQSLSQDLEPAIRASVALAKKLLNKYYSKTDQSELYRVCMILNPRYKLQYFKSVDWQPSWIQEAQDLVREIYNREYRRLSVQEESDDGESEGPGSNNESDDEVEEKLVHGKKKRNQFSKLPSISGFATAALEDELDRYLREPLVNIKNPLKWWYQQRKTYPRLSRMARDYHSILATSVDVERVFSKGRLLLSHVRSRLSAQTTRAVLCLGSWSLLGLVKDDDVKIVTRMADVTGPDEILENGWDLITLLDKSK